MLVTETISPLNRPDPIVAMSDEASSAADIAALTARMVHSDETAWREFYDGYFNRLLR